MVVPPESFLNCVPDVRVTPGGTNSHSLSCRQSFSLRAPPPQDRQSSQAGSDQEKGGRSGNGRRRRAHDADIVELEEAGVVPESESQGCGRCRCCHSKRGRGIRKGGPIIERKDNGSIPRSLETVGGTSIAPQKELQVVRPSRRRRQVLGDKPEAANRTEGRAEGSAVFLAGDDGSEPQVAGPGPRGEVSTLEAAVRDDVPCNTVTDAGYGDR